MSYLTTSFEELEEALIEALEGEGFSFNPLTTSFPRYLATALGEPNAYLRKSVAQMLSEIDTQYGGSLSHLTNSVAHLMDDVTANIGAGGGGGGEEPAINVTGSFIAPAWDFISPDSGNAAIFAIAPDLSWLNGNISDQEADYSGVTTLASSLVSAVVGDIVLTSDEYVVLTDLAFPGLKAIDGNALIWNFNAPALLTSVALADLVYVSGDLDLEGDGLEAIDLPVLTAVDGSVSFYAPAATGIDVSALVSAGLLNCSGLTVSALDVGALTTVGANCTFYSMPMLTSLDVSSLTTVVGTLTVGSMNSLESVVFPSLTTVLGADLSIAQCSALVSVGFPSLVTIGNTFDPNGCPLWEEMSFPMLATVGLDFIPNSGLDAMTSISLPAIEQIGGRIEISNGLGGIPSLQNFTLGATLKNIVGDVIMDACALLEASVDNILVRLAALDGTNGTTSYDNHTVTVTGTSDPPSAAGLTAKATLEGRGNTVTVN